MTNPDKLPPESNESNEQRANPSEETLEQANNSSSGKERGNDGRNPSEVADSAPMVPLKPATPDRAIVSIMENPSVLEALVHEAPAEVLQFVEAADDRQFRYFCQKEANRHQERMAREATTRIAIGSVSGAVLAAFIYSAYTGDINLSSTIVTAIIGGFGGLGISKYFQPKEEEES